MLETTIYIQPPHTKTHGESKEEHRRPPQLKRMPLFYFYFIFQFYFDIPLETSAVEEDTFIPVAKLRLFDNDDAEIRHAH